MTDSLRGVKPEALRDLYSRAVALGCEAEISRANRVVLTLPDGRRFYGALTGSDRRGTLNARATLRQMGLDL